MSKAIFIGIPVSNLSRSTRFYEALGFELNSQFSDDTTSTMIWSGAIAFQLQTHDKFKGWVSKSVVDSQAAAGALFSLTQESRDAVDAIVQTAEATGGKAGFRAPIDMGWLYNRSFEDPDGHMFEAVWFQAPEPN